MSFIPPRPFGDDEEAVALQAIWDHKWNPKTIVFRDTEATKWDKHADGTHTLYIKVPRGGSSPPVTWFVGEYNPLTEYQPQQAVIISMGSNAGSYVCIATSIGNAPYLGGGYWVQLPFGAALGQWS